MVIVLVLVAVVTVVIMRNRVSDGDSVDEDVSGGDKSSGKYRYVKKSQSIGCVIPRCIKTRIQIFFSYLNHPIKSQLKM